MKLSSRGYDLHGRILTQVASALIPTVVFLGLCSVGGAQLADFYAQHGVESRSLTEYLVGKVETYDKTTKLITIKVDLGSHEKAADIRLAKNQPAYISDRMTNNRPECLTVGTVAEILARDDKEAIVTIQLLDFWVEWSTDNLKPTQVDTKIYFELRRK